MRVSEEEEVWLTKVRKGLIQCETVGVITTRAKEFRKLRLQSEEGEVQQEEVLDNRQHIQSH